MEVITAIIGVFIGFCLSELKEWFRRHKRTKTHFKAIKAEIEFCSQMAKRFIEDKIAAPLYRLPANTYRTSLPQLLIDSMEQ